VILQSFELYKLFSIKNFLGYENRKDLKSTSSWDFYEIDFCNALHWFEFRKTTRIGADLGVFIHFVINFMNIIDCFLLYLFSFRPKIHISLHRNRIPFMKLIVKCVERQWRGIVKIIDIFVQKIWKLLNKYFRSIIIPVWLQINLMFEL
jgi:hypothetical protein